jgi:excisionase family DNA binding protein
VDKATFDEQELAEVLGISVRTLRRKLKAGEVPAPLLGGSKSKRWSRHTIARWIESQPEPATEQDEGQPNHQQPGPPPAQVAPG